jgi:mRNA deadenylase 3'-5' endonuclease subunit Ccr4
MWLQEILRYSPDIVCLQEVDHFTFLGQQMHLDFYFKK